MSKFIFIFLNMKITRQFQFHQKGIVNIMSSFFLFYHYFLVLFQSSHSFQLFLDRFLPFLINLPQKQLLRVSRVSLKNYSDNTLPSKD